MATRTELLQGATLTQRLSGMTPGYDRVKLFLYCDTRDNIIKQFSTNTESGFTLFTVDGSDLIAALESEDTAITKGELYGEIMIWYGTNPVEKGSYDTLITIVSSVSKSEVA